MKHHQSDVFVAKCWDCPVSRYEYNQKTRIMTLHCSMMPDGEMYKLIIESDKLVALHDVEIPAWCPLPDVKGK